MHDNINSGPRTAEELNALLDCIECDSNSTTGLIEATLKGDLEGDRTQRNGNC